MPECRNSREKFASVRHRHSSIRVSPVPPLVTIYSYPLPSYDYTQYAYGTVGLQDENSFHFFQLRISVTKNTLYCRLCAEICKNIYSYVLTTDFACIYIFVRFSCMLGDQKKTSQKKPKNFPANCALKADPSKQAQHLLRLDSNASRTQNSNTGFKGQSFESLSAGTLKLQ